MEHTPRSAKTGAVASNAVPSEAAVHEIDR